MIWKTSLKTERIFSMPLHFSLEGLQNGLSLIFPISPIKIQVTFSINGNYLNLNSSPYLGTQKKVRKAEAELDSLRMKEGGHVSSYIADFRSHVSRIGDWGERALSHHLRKGLLSRILDQLASHPARIDSLQNLIDITLELDTRYHESQNEKSHHQEKKPEASKSNPSHPQIPQAQVKRRRIFRRDTSLILLC
ncbi:hypothetical protein O181_057412 [Austropuccinia psidii MF-1]|uniref:Retrotransposon gag domain-containing protein n=1 Tax=Austropuccinia psidii MF-1 TaxID=1389203 RepID=A0A9Q3EHR7_9BASI|nr:hypothetical protein [Austropuccinia psidii MF-1]